MATAEPREDTPLLAKKKTDVEILAQEIEEGIAKEEKIIEKEVAEEEKVLSEGMAQLKTAYGFETHATFTQSPMQMDEGDYVTDYEPLKFSSLRVCCACRGTILMDPVLAVEQILLTTMFFACAFPVYYFFKHNLGAEPAGGGGIGSGILPFIDLDMTLSRWIREQETKMRAFAMIMTTLAAFLLSFYTSIAVGRWWIMRTQGVGGIKAATVDLELLLYQNVTQDEKVLDAVRRYGRTSLMLMFLWRTQKMKVMKKWLTKENLLTEHECDQLLKWNHCLHETIWAWQSGIVTMLYKEGKVQSDQLFSQLLQKCMEGREAAQCVHTHLAVRVPMQYIHLLGLLVKMHNGVLSIIMGLLFGAAWGNSQLIVMVQCFGRTLILPFLFNAILLINAELSDPFNGGEADFPVPIYQAALEKDCNSMIKATQNMPDWLSERYNAQA